MDGDREEGARHGPVPTLAELRRMSPAELAALAGRIRDRLIDVVANNGGHLAPNLGVVELTIALHRSFLSPRDKIIWDVGHQSYVHKLLTGRWEDFVTLRRLGGLAGFPRRSESPHDPFETGHASTSISAALGLAKARDLLHLKHHVLAVIGDGALTGGMAFEALNHAGHAKTPVIIVINDNSMSISPSVGGLAQHLARARTHPLYWRTKEDIKSWLNQVPGGPSVATVLGRVRTSLKYLLIPGVLFEELGLTYLGPIDGHDIGQLEEAFAQAKAIRGPVVVHCLTRKGRGYLPAEANPSRFHGLGPFDRESGKSVGKNPQPASYSDVFGHCLVAAAAGDERVCAITAAMPDGTGLGPFFKAFPDRSFDVCIAEQHAVTLAAGLAAGGLRPVVAIYSTFLQRAYDQVLHDVCLQRLPVVFALDRAGIVGEDGQTHHGLYDLAYLRSMPSMAVAVPRDGPTLEALLRLGLGRADGPFALRYPRGSVVAEPLPAPAEGDVALGKGELLREGSDYGALAAARLLEADGVSAAVADARFVKPLDRDLILGLCNSARALLVVEEGVAAGGLASAVMELLAAEGKFGETRIKAMGVPDEPVPHGQPAALRALYGLDAAGIAAACRAFLAGGAGGAGQRS